MSQRGRVGWIMGDSSDEPTGFLDSPRLLTSHPLQLILTATCTIPQFQKNALIETHSSSSFIIIHHIYSQKISSVSKTLARGYGNWDAGVREQVEDEADACVPRMSLRKLKRVLT